MCPVGDVVADRRNELGDERVFAAEQLVHHHPEREDIGLPGGGLTGYLLR